MLGQTRGYVGRLGLIVGTDLGGMMSDGQSRLGQMYKTCLLVQG